MNCWINIPSDSHFTLENIPFGIAYTAEKSPFVCTRLGDTIVDLSWMSSMAYFHEITPEHQVFITPYLNDFIALGKDVTNGVRAKVQEVMCDYNEKDLMSYGMYQHSDCEMLLPVFVGDITTFSNCEPHARHIGEMIKNKEKPLFDNWRHIPVSFRGRASNITLSQVEYHRPKGQIVSKLGVKPEVLPTLALDYELQIAFVVGKSNKLGDSISVNDAEEYIFGAVLLNDLAARDLQAWENQPLSSFLPKNLASVISPWVVTTEALDPFRTPVPVIIPTPLNYLQSNADLHYDIALRVEIETKNSSTTSCETNFRQTYWNIAQQLTQLTLSGTLVRVGDLIASGTISGDELNSQGCLLESTKNGKQPVKLTEGSFRSFLEDGDSVIMTAIASKNGVRVGFGEVKCTIIPAKKT